MPISLRLNPDIEKRLNHLATVTGRTKSFYLKALIEQGLNDLEDYYSASLVQERVRKGEEAVHSAHEVRRDLGLDD